MCRTIHCFMRTQGYGHEVGSMAALLGLLAGHGLGKMGQKEKSQEDFIKDAIKAQELDIRISEAVIGILRADPPQEGANLVALEAAKPIDPDKHGFATIVSYELADGSFLVVGTDHMTQEKVAHTTPNMHGLQGLTEAIRQELVKKAVEAEADAAAKAAAQEPSA